MRECKWLETEKVWEITIQHLEVGVGDLSEWDRAQKIKREGTAGVYVSEEKIRAKVLISAVGALVEPKLLSKSLPGQDIFKGEIFHSARFDYNVDLKDKDVIVVGTGCSAAQFAPRLRKEYGAKSVTQLMRSPPWVVPRPQPPGGKEWWETWSPWLNSTIPGFGSTIRFTIAAAAESEWRYFLTGDYNERERKKLEKELLAHMKATVPKKYQEILTPNYSVGCKRRIFDAAWFPGLHDPAFELTTLPLTSIGENSVTLGPGRAYPPLSDTASTAPVHEVTVPADVIILASGFETTQWLHPLDITGRNGRKLHDAFDEQGGASM